MQFNPRNDLPFHLVRPVAPTPSAWKNLLLELISGSLIDGITWPDLRECLVPCGHTCGPSLFHRRVPQPHPGTHLFSTTDPGSPVASFFLFLQFYCCKTPRSPTNPLSTAPRTVSTRRPTPWRSTWALDGDPTRTFKPTSTDCCATNASRWNPASKPR